MKTLECQAREFSSFGCKEITKAGGPVLCSGEVFLEESLGYIGDE